ncbi:Oligopeptide transport ATP-binding protein OppD [Salipiger mucosus]|uniref:Oligopeptide transport ATP-binding protein OppD n=1 Tax=Salipiger mucosus DSM 16094 TaxID=1123237 RepID=S9RCK9_9RHOB|nr:Oligopeptide transport ATP-binding protein OppD [Salipiger mucosus]EPX75865.1 Oligopeptide transport ATP-binding protein OppD [Salipiger mucosus DSM 16094]
MPGTRLSQIEGMPPSPTAIGAGDPFAPRNPFATDRCLNERPTLAQAIDSVEGHKVAAWYDLRPHIAAQG